MSASDSALHLLIAHPDCTALDQIQHQLSRFTQRRSKELGITATILKSSSTAAAVIGVPLATLDVNGKSWICAYLLNNLTAVNNPKVPESFIAAYIHAPWSRVAVIKTVRGSQAPASPVAS